MSQLNSTGKALLYIAGLVFLASAYLSYNTLSFPPPVVPNAPGPATLPRMVLVGIFIALPFAVYETIQKHRIANGESGIKIEVKEIAFSLALVLFFSLFLDTLGFEVVSTVVLFLSLLVTTRKPVLSLVLAVGGVLTCYVVFVAFLKVYVQTSFLPTHPLQFLGY